MSSLALSLQITLIGMGLVFGAIIVLWGLMVLLTAVIKEPKKKTEPVPPVPAEIEVLSEQDEIRARAAAAAVALALAEQGASAAHPLVVPPPTLVSAWQLMMRTRQMTQKGNLYKKEKK